MNNMVNVSFVRWIHQRKPKNLHWWKGYALTVAILKDKIMEERLKFNIQNNTPILVHKICRRDFPDKKRSLKASETNSHPSREPHWKRLGSSIEACDSKSQCFYCGKKSPTDKINAKRNLIQIVTFVEFHKNILEKCCRRNDAWGDEVYIRLSCSNDLVADEGTTKHVYKDLWRIKNHKI